MTSDVNNLYGMVITYRCIRSQSPSLNMGGNREAHVLSYRAMWPYVTSVFLIQQEQPGSQLLESLGPVRSQSLDGHMKYTALHNHPVFSWIDLVRTRAGHGIGGLLQFGWFITPQSYHIQPQPIDFFVNFVAAVDSVQLVPKYKWKVKLRSWGFPNIFVWNNWTSRKWGLW